MTKSLDQALHDAREYYENKPPEPYRPKGLPLHSEAAYWPAHNPYDLPELHDKHDWYDHPKD